jgi:hypothetical protein
MVTSRLAIASLVLSLSALLLGPLGFIPGIICGHLALSSIKQDPTLKGRGIALAGLIVGYVYIALLLLAAIGLVVLAPMIVQPYRL